MQNLPNHNDDGLGVNTLSVSAEGRVENQKLIQTAAILSLGWVFGFQLDLLEKNLTTLAGFTFIRFELIVLFYAYILQTNTFPKTNSFLAKREKKTYPLF